jgi:transposase-like protein
MEADVEGVIGAGRHERTVERATYRNGYRDRSLDTRLGSLQLRIPKLRQGSYFPPFLEPRKLSEKALVAVIQEAWISGVSTRRVDDLVQAMGLSGIGKSTVSKLCPLSANASVCLSGEETSTSELAASSIDRSLVIGPISGWTRPT